MRICRFAFVFAVMALAAGCNTPRQYVFTHVSSTLPSELPSRIVIVTFDGANCEEDAKALVTESIAHEMQVIMRSEIIIASPEDDRLAGEAALQRRGRIDLEALIEARKRYNADAFVFGAITQYKAYDPPVLGLYLRMLSADTGEAIWAAEAVFDAHDQTVRKMVEEYFKQSGLQDRLAGPELMFMSPRHYSRFVATRILKPLGDEVAAQPVHPRVNP